MEKQIFNGKSYYRYKGERYFTKGAKKLHRVVWEFYNGKIPKGYHIHHKDHDTANNDILNLEMIEASLHFSYHMKLRDKDELINRMNYARTFANEWHKSEEGHKFHSELAKKQWQNRESQIKNCIFCGKEYETKHKGKSFYCHLNCKMKHYRRLGKVR
jgi:hypothetical protein